jgi:hypothetical protein
MVPDPTNPQSLNRYSYVLGNALKYRDPSGHCMTNSKETTRGDRFDCSVDELQNLDWDIRAWWIRGLGDAAGASRWFENITGILGFFKNTEQLSDLKGWASVGDAALLWAVQDGYRSAFKSGETAKSVAGGLWKDFFLLERKDTVNLKQAYVAWGKAEQEGTRLGEVYADKEVGRPTGLTGTLLRNFIELGDWYRNSLAQYEATQSPVLNWPYEPILDPRTAFWVTAGAQYALQVTVAEYYHSGPIFSDSP